MDRTRRNGLPRCFRSKVGSSLSVMLLAAIIGTILFAYLGFGSEIQNGSTSIEQVIFVFRHGDRNPTETYRNDPYLEYDWPGGWGALTKKGMLQMYKTGQWIRKEYGKVIGEEYKSSRSYILSSYADRCLMSGQALLAGLYPPNPNEMFVPGLAWQPIPIHYVPRNFDKVVVVESPCPRLKEALKEAYANETKKSGERLAKYYEELTAYTGQSVKTITDVEFLYNTLEIEEQNGLKLPEWTSRYYNQEMREIAARSLAIFTSNTLQKRLRGGPLLKDILKHIMDHKDGQGGKQVYLYSAHDITLVNLIKTMGFTSELLKPDYAATLIFELHTFDEGKEREVKLKYLNNTETNVAHTMNIPNCATPCLLKDLLELWKDVIPDNWDEECQL